MNQKTLSILTTLIGIFAFIAWGLSKLSEKTISIILAVTALCASIAKMVYLLLTMFEDEEELPEE